MAAETDIILRILQEIVPDTDGARRAAQATADEIQSARQRLLQLIDADSPEADIQQSLAALGKVEEALRRLQTLEGQVEAAEGFARRPQAGAPRTSQTRALGLAELAALPQINNALTQLFGTLKTELSQRAPAQLAADQKGALQERVAAQQLTLADPEAIEAAAQERLNLARLEAATLKELVGAESKLRDEYVNAQATIRSLNAQTEAAVLGRLAKDRDYTKAIAEARSLQEQINTTVKRRLLRDTAYIKSVAQGQTLQQQINNRVLNQQLRRTSGYTEAVAKGRELQQRVNNRVTGLLATNDRYLNALATAAKNQQRINNEVLQRQLRASSGYAAQVAKGKTLQAQLNVEVQNRLASGKAYAAAQAQGAAAQQTINNKVLAIQGESGSLYAAAQAKGKFLQEKLNAEVSRQLTAIPGYANAVVEGQVEQRRVNNEVLRAQLSAGSQYAAEQAEGKLLQEQLNNRIQAQLLQKGFGAEQAQGDLAGRRLAQQRADALIREQFRESTEQGALLSEATLQRDRARERASNDKLIEANAQATAAKQLEAAKTRELLFSEERYKESLLISAQTKAKEALLTERNNAIAQLNIPIGDQLAATELKAKATAQQRVFKEHERLVQTQVLLGVGDAQITAERQQLHFALKEIEAGRSSASLQQQIAAIRSKRLANEQQLGFREAGGAGSRAGVGGLGIGYGFKSVLRFGIASTAIYGLARGTAEAVREAAELEKVLNQVGRQFEGQFGDGSARATQALERFKQSVFDVAKLTGEAADEVARVGFQLQGAFRGDTARAIAETKDALIAARVTDLDIKEVIDSFTALTQSFADANVTIRDFSDVALKMQEDLGVLAKETVAFAADFAPVGAAVGFTADQIAVLGAVAQQVSGRSGSALAEGFNRIFPQLQENAADIILLFDSLSEELGDELAQAFSGDGGVAAGFNALLRNYDLLSEAQKGALADLLGGRREAQAIIGVLDNSAKVFRGYASAQDKAGTTQEYFNDLQETLQLRLAQLGEQFKVFAQQLFEGGLKDFFEDFIDLLSLTLDVAQQLTTVFAELAGVINDLTGGIAGEAIGPAIQSLLLFAAGRGVFRAIKNMRAASAAAGATSVATGGLTGTLTPTAGGGPLSSLGAGAAAQGAATASRFAPKFFPAFQKAFLAKVPLGAVGIGAAAGAFFWARYEQNVKESAQKAVSNLEQGGFTDTQVKDVFEGIGLGDLGTERGTIRRLLEQGDTARQLKKDLQGVAKQNASFFQQVLDTTPFVSSGDLAVKEAQINAVVDTINDEFVKFYEETLGLVSTNDDLAKQLARITRAAVANLTPEDLIPEGDLKSAIENQPSGRGAHLDPKTEREISSALGDQYKEELENITNRINEASDEELPKVLAELRAEAESEDISPEWKEVLTEVIKKIEGPAKEFQKIQNLVTEATQTLDQTLANYELGQSSRPEVIRAYERKIQALEATGREDDITKALELRMDLREFLADFVQSDIEALERFENLTGRDVAAIKIARLQQELESSDLTLAQRGTLVDQIIEIRREQAQAAAEAAETEAERAAILAGFVELTNAEVSTLYGSLLITNEEFKSALADFVGNPRVEQAVEAIATAVVTEAESTAQATINYINQFRARQGVLVHAFDLVTEIFVNLEREVLNAIGSGLDFAIADIGAIGGPGFKLADDLDENLDNLPEEVQTAIEFFNDVIGAFNEGFAADLGQIPVSTDGVDGGEAEDQADLARRIAEAQLDLLLAQVEGDPVKEARIAQQQADLAMANASDEAERIQAMADRVRADRSMQEALNDIANSQIELLIAQADAAGETVRSAELQVEAIKQTIAQAKSLGLGEAELNRLSAELTSAEASERDAFLSDRREYFQYLKDVGKITDQQLIGYLQTLQAIPDLTDQQRRDLEREIYNLRQRLGQDFQFNLPSTILPTFYEVRRLGDAGGALSSYQDNRRIEVTVNAETNASADDIATAVAGAVGEPLRNGTSDRRF